MSYYSHYDDTHPALDLHEIARFYERDVTDVTQDMIDNFEFDRREAALADEADKRRDER